MIPHRTGTLTVDADPRDWRGQGTVLHLQDPRPGPDANRARVALAWGSRFLYAVFEVTGGHIVPPPEGAPLASLYQGDSVELYLDGAGNRAEAIDDNDYQFLAACDGRSAVLQGDPVLARVKLMAVPKTLRTSPAVQVAARLTAVGYTVELAVPLNAVLTTPVRPGVRLALDVAMNDWDAPPPALAEPSLDDVIEASRRPPGEGDSESTAAGDDPFRLALQLGDRPWSLCNGANTPRYLV